MPAHTVLCSCSHSRKIIMRTRGGSGGSGPRIVGAACGDDAGAATGAETAAEAGVAAGPAGEGRAAVFVDADEDGLAADFGAGSVAAGGGEAGAVVAGGVAALAAGVLRAAGTLGGAAAG